MTATRLVCGLKDGQVLQTTDKRCHFNHTDICSRNMILDRPRMKHYMDCVRVFIQCQILQYEVFIVPTKKCVCVIVI